MRSCKVGRRIGRILGPGAFLLSLAAGSAAVAGGQGRGLAPGPTDASPELRSDDLGQSLDSLIRAHIAAYDIPGLALLLVRGGRLESRAYGFADLETARPIEVEATRFGVGSVSKVVTSAAVVQLAQQGLLDLRGDINRYLPAPLVPEAFHRPITLLDLLTHTAGLESRNLGIAARSPDAIRALREFLAKELPARAYPPGSLYVYSQHGFGLAGLAVEWASGRSFANAMTSLVLEPLGMVSSSFEPAAMEHPDVAVGYDPALGPGSRAAPGFHHLAPAAGLVLTPADLGRLMLALLGSANVGAGSPGFADESVRTLLLERHYSPSPNPAVEGPALGLYEYRYGPDRALTTRGWTGGHSTYVHLVPERDVGVAFLANSAEVYGLEIAVRELLHEHLSPSPNAVMGTGQTLASQEGESPPLHSYVGEYRGLGFAGHGLEAVARALLSPRISMRVVEDGELEEEGALEVDMGSGSVRLTPVEPSLFHTSWQEGREQYFAFVDGEDGSPRFLHWGVMTYERLEWWQERTTHLVFLAFLALSFGLGLGGTVLRGVAARQRTIPGDDVESWTLWLVGAVSLLPLAMIAVIAVEMMGRYEVLATGLPWRMRAALWIPVLMVPLVLALIIAMPRILRSTAMPNLARAHYLQVGIAALAFVGYVVGLGLFPLF